MSRGYKKAVLGTAFLEVTRLLSGRYALLSTI